MTLLPRLHTAPMAEWHIWKDLEVAEAKPRYYPFQGCKNPGYQVAVVTKFCTLAIKICGSSVWNSLQVTLLAPRIPRWRRQFRKICGNLIPIATQERLVHKGCSPYLRAAPAVANMKNQENADVSTEPSQNTAYNLPKFIKFWRCQQRQKEEPAINLTGLRTVVFCM
jgi:hypothetical protein